MKIDTAPVGAATVLTLHGPLVREELDDLRRGVALAQAGGAARTVLDMHDVPYLDSGGIECLVALCGGAAGPARPRLAKLDETCREALALTRVLEQMTVFDTVESAVRSFRQ